MFKGLLACALLIDFQYLPDKQQESHKAAWAATGVKFPEGLKFYKLTDVSQRHVTVNGRKACGIYDTKGANNVNRQDPWETPAGLNFSPKSQWTKAAAVYLPDLPVVFKEPVEVLNSFNSYQTEIRWSWEFPDGTVFAEMLMSKWQGMDLPFEIRVREKHGGKWDEGTTYRPYTHESLPAGSTKVDYHMGTNRRKDFGVINTDKVVVNLLPDNEFPILRMGRFQPSRVVAVQKEGGLIPKGYVGTMTTCVNCHARAGDPTEYGTTGIRGSDTIFSWHPFTLETINSDDDPRIDARWAKRHRP